jgi:hypothetical protein
MSFKWHELSNSNYKNVRSDKTERLLAARCIFTVPTYWVEIAYRTFITIDFHHTNKRASQREIR